MIELIGVLMLAITPWLLKTVTNFIKLITDLKYSPNKAFIARFIVAFLSIALAVAHAVTSGEPVPADAIERFVDALKVFAEALILWLSTTGLYLLSKRGT